MTNLDDLKCLYELQAEKRIAMGITEKPFLDVDCFNCQEPYSAIICPYYINRSYLQEFKKLELRISGR